MINYKTFIRSQEVGNKVWEIIQLFVKKGPLVSIRYSKSRITLSLTINSKNRNYNKETEKEVNEKVIELSLLETS